MSYYAGPHDPVIMYETPVQYETSSLTPHAYETLTLGTTPYHDVDTSV